MHFKSLHFHSFIQRGVGWFALVKYTWLQYGHRVWKRYLSSKNSEIIYIVFKYFIKTNTFEQILFLGIWCLKRISRPLWILYFAPFKILWRSPPLPPPRLWRQEPDTFRGWVIGVLLSSTLMPFMWAYHH